MGSKPPCSALLNQNSEEGSGVSACPSGCRSTQPLAQTWQWLPTGAPEPPTACRLLLGCPRDAARDPTVLVSGLVQARKMGPTGNHP